MATANLLARWVKRTALALTATLTLSHGALAATPIVILATKSFTEQHILSAMTVQYLQKKGFQVQPANQYRHGDLP